ncbi:hypothetical protein D9Q98_002668 [Chlorella vulgaris]|uniref:Transcription factor TFIIIC triple barrel domain-containing protein n=1 Tax=Chlorella vulgaris TaxID=3077 RepID=A0A9D4TTZ4_CHLVU|nr:hypothetical protein D9Q98_002668 [Chlorella vulgaris]
MAQLSGGEAEGQEASVYVVLDLPDLAAMPPPGSLLQLQGMETQQPTLQLADGTRLVGAFSETVGTQLVLADSATGIGGGHRVELLAHTDKRISFTQPPETDRGAGGAAATTAHVQAAAGASQPRQQQQRGGPG